MFIAKGLCVLLFLTIRVIVSSTNGEILSTPHTQTKSDKPNGTHNEVVINNKKRNRGGGFVWGWGGGGGGGGGGSGGGGGGGGGGSGGGGWGWGGGGGGYWGWGCIRPRKNNGKVVKYMHKGRVYSSEDYKIGEFAQCVVKGRCKGLRLDCPLHCGGTCFYDCKFMCKAHCRRL